MTTEQTIDTTEGQKVNVDPMVSEYYRIALSGAMAIWCCAALFSLGASYYSILPFIAPVIHWFLLYR